jgi:hypothetical protein
VDVGSSTSASSVVGLVAGAVKNLVIDMAVVLQVRVVVCAPFRGSLSVSQYIGSIQLRSRCMRYPVAHGANDPQYLRCQAPRNSSPA